MENIIKCDKITKIYNQGSLNETIALKSVSFEIKKGEYVAIMGPSGSGKSTLMHILGALDSPTGGIFLLDGKDVSKMSDDELAEIRKEKIGFVFQSFNLLPRTTVTRNVMLPLIYNEIAKKERKQIVESALNSVGIAQERWNHFSNELSGGQMQRVAIARALVNNPSLVLADEPTGNLDTKTGELVLETFNRLNKKFGHTILLITHEKDVATHADRIIYIQDGILVKDEKISKKQ
ncbi:MAG: ABC transporter [Candidatus Moranbacteria bacterium CG_4_8_14_3_um_filter_34_16]|nr:MAG: ABC transporter [Candidatus Moranbacteria bacterium CG_4_8_14_3_um_filter_34_16]